MEYKQLSVAVDICLFRSIDVEMGHRKGKGKALQILLVRREIEPYQQKWSLPGGFVDAESGLLLETAKTKLLEKTGVRNVYLEQLKTFDALNRDSRDRVLSVAYLGVTNEDSYEVVESHSNARWFTVGDGILNCENKLTIAFDSLAFDHKQILIEALQRLKGKLDYSDLAFRLLPNRFTIKEAQQLFELIQGHRTDSFKRKLGNRVVETDEIVKRVGKPAKLYKGVLTDND